MYHVVEMKGDFEPWWFLEDWQEDIVKVQEFDDYYEALKWYKVAWRRLYAEFPHFNSRSNLMSAFWDETEQRWCEECDEYLQQYHSILLLSDWEKIPDSWRRPGYKKKNCQIKHQTCQIKKEKTVN